MIYYLINIITSQFKISMRIEGDIETGKTMTTGGNLGYEWAFGQKNATLINMSYMRGITIKNKNEYMIRPLNNLPNHLKAFTKVERKFKGAIIEDFEYQLNESMSDVNHNLFNDSIIRSIVPGTTESKASMAGRGYSAVFILIDEINFFRFIKIVLPAIINSHNARKTAAENAGLRHWICFASTPGDLNKEHGQYMYDHIYNRYLEFNIRYFDYTRKELDNALMKKGTNFFRIKFNYDELGFGEDYLEDRIRENGVGNELRVEILLDWVMDSSLSPFSQSELERLKKLKEIKYYTDIKDIQGYQIEYYPFTPGESFEDTIRKCNAISIGVDTAQGVGSENSAIFGTSLLDGRPIMSFKNNRINTNDFPVLVCELFRTIREINPMCLPLLVVERTGIGKVVCDKVADDPAIEPFVFITVVNKGNEVKKKWSEKKLKNNREAIYGVPVNEESRSRLFEQVLQEVVKKYPSFVKCQNLIDELVTLTKTKSKNGRVKIQHADGATDDLVFAAMHSWSVIFIDEYRKILEEEFNFYIDFNHFKLEPIGSSIARFSKLGVENDYGNKVFTGFDAVEGDNFEVIHVPFYYKIVDGVQVRLSDKESREYERSINGEESTIKAIADENRRNARKYREKLVDDFVEGYQPIKITEKGLNSSKDSEEIFRSLMSGSGFRLDEFGDNDFDDFNPFQSKKARW